MALTFENGGNIQGVVMAMKTCFTVSVAIISLMSFFFPNLEAQNCSTSLELGVQQTFISEHLTFFLFFLAV